MKMTLNTQNLFFTKRKAIELVVLLFFSIFLYYIWAESSSVVFFVTGFLWNWSASQKIDYAFKKNGYRFSFLKMIYNLEFLFCYPFKKLPSFFLIVPRSIPAFLFFFGVNNFFGAGLNVIPVMIGSFLYELIQLDKILFNEPVKDHLPEIPKE